MTRRYLLMKRGNVEYFNARIPADVLDDFPKIYNGCSVKNGIIKFSLRTPDINKAKKLRQQYESEITAICERIREVNTIPKAEMLEAMHLLGVLEIIPNDVVRLDLNMVLKLQKDLSLRLERILSDLKLDLAERSQASPNPEHVYPSDALFQEANTLRFVLDALALYERMFKEAGFSPREYQQRQQKLHHKNTTAKLFGYLSGKNSAPLESGIIIDTQSNARNDSSSKTYPILSQAFIEWKDNPDKSSPLRLDSILETKKFVDKFIQRYGDLQLNDITRAEIKEFRDEWRKIPINLSNKINRLPYPEIIALNNAGKLKGEKRSNSSTNKAVNSISRIFGIVGIEYGLQNPALKLVLPKATGGRDIYKPDQLHRLFNSPLYRGYQSENKRHVAGSVKPIRDAYYWLPLLGLFTGCREEELCQLYVDDVMQDAGIWYIRVNMDNSDQHVKNKWSLKCVPLHPEFLKCGFIDYVQSVKKAGHKRVFYEFSKGAKGTYSALFTKWYGDLTVDIGLRETKDNKLVFHSFRNTLTNILKKHGVPKDVRLEILGHVRPKDDHDAYPELYTVPELYAYLHKCDMGVDLSHLHTASHSEKPLPIKPRPIKKGMKPATATTNKTYKLKVRRTES